MATAVIGTVLLGAFVFVGYSTYKNRKKGGCCGGDCSNCARCNDPQKH